jgi:hypothetical protein
MGLTLSRKLYAAFNFVILTLVICALLVWDPQAVGRRDSEQGRQSTIASAALAGARSAKGIALGCRTIRGSE